MSPKPVRLTAFEYDALIDAIAYRDAEDEGRPDSEVDWRAQRARDRIVAKFRAAGYQLPARKTR